MLRAGCERPESARVSPIADLPSFHAACSPLFCSPPPDQSKTFFGSGARRCRDPNAAAHHLPGPCSDGSVNISAALRPCRLLRGARGSHIVEKAPVLLLASICGPLWQAWLHCGRDQLDPGRPNRHSRSRRVYASAAAADWGISRTASTQYCLFLLCAATDHCCMPSRLPLAQCVCWHALHEKSSACVQTPAARLASAPNKSASPLRASTRGHTTRSMIAIHSRRARRRRRR